MNKLIFLICSVISFNATAVDLFTQADIKVGKALVEQHCVSCHTARFGGDGSEIYTRPSRKVNSSARLIAQVQACSTSLDLKWFDDEELNAAAYLNKQYYRFEQ